MDPVRSSYTTYTPQPLSQERSSSTTGRQLIPPTAGGERIKLSPRAGSAGESDSSRQGLRDQAGREEEFVPYGADGRRPSSSPRSATFDTEDEAPQIQQMISRLEATESKVRAHEAAHKAAGGALTGPVSYSYSRGPDGKNYITGGDVSISISSGKTPEETVRRMEQVIRAALAPADPSSQDRAVAARATSLAQQARTEESSTTSQLSGNGEEVGQGEELSRKEPAPPLTGDGEDRIIPGQRDTAYGLGAEGNSGMTIATRLSRLAYADPAVNAPVESPLRLSMPTPPPVDGSVSPPSGRSPAALSLYA